MNRALLGAAICVFACACQEDAPVYVPQRGTVSGAVEAVPPPLPREYPLKPEYMKSLEPAGEAAAALRGYNPDFRLWAMADYPEWRVKYYPFSENSLPYALRGDYNGDGIADLVVAGYDRDANIILALISSGTGYRTIEVDNVQFYHKARVSGRKVVPAPDKMLIAKAAGRKFGYGDRSYVEIVLEREGFVLKGIKDLNAAYAWTDLPLRGYGNDWLFVCEWTGWSDERSMFQCSPINQISEDYDIHSKYPGNDVDF